MEKKARRYYSNGTVAALMTLARGGCYAPECGIPTIRLIDGVPVLNLEIAHIRAFEEGGPRFDPDLSERERNAFYNLILLCTAHHKTVDDTNSDRYPVEVLEEWKFSRESDGLDALAGLGDLTEAKLSAMLAGAKDELLDRVGPALDEFSKTAPELAGLLKVLLAELADPRVHGFGISEDGILMLSRSADAFSSLEDSAITLLSAANKLGNLEDKANLLKRAAAEIRIAASALADARFGG